MFVEGWGEDPATKGAAYLFYLLNVLPCVGAV